MAGVYALQSNQASDGLDALTRELVFSQSAPALTPFRALWPPAALPPHDRVAPMPLPVLAWLPAVAAQSSAFAAPLVAAFCRAAPSLQWRQTYSLQEVGEEFLRGYGYTELIGPMGPHESSQLACGFLLLGPQIEYPRHRHEAEEIYLVLSGDAEWLQGDGIWRQHPPGRVIHHASEETHAMRTGVAPLLALYLWRSANLQQKARLDPRGTAEAGTA